MSLITFEARQFACVTCNAPLPMESYSVRSPGSPELVRTTPLAWYGLVWDEQKGPSLLVCCSHECVRRLLSP